MSTENRPAAYFPSMLPDEVVNYAESYAETELEKALLRVVEELRSECIPVDHVSSLIQECWDTIGNLEDLLHMVEDDAYEAVEVMIRALRSEVTEIEKHMGG